MSNHSSQPASPAYGPALAGPPPASPAPARPPEANRVLRLLALTAVGIGVLVLAAAAFLLSYPGIHAVALQSGVSPSLARVYPVIFDAMLVIACAAVLSLRGAGALSRSYAWLALLVLLAAAAGADALHSTGIKLPHRPAAAAAAIIPWALVLIGFGLLLAMLRHARLHRAAVAAQGTTASGNLAPGTGAGSGLSAPYRPAGPQALPPWAGQQGPQPPYGMAQPPRGQGQQLTGMGQLSAPAQHSPPAQLSAPAQLGPPAQLGAPAQLSAPAQPPAPALPAPPVQAASTVQAVPSPVQPSAPPSSGPPSSAPTAAKADDAAAHPAEPNADQPDPGEPPVSQPDRDREPALDASPDLADPAAAMQAGTERVAAEPVYVAAPAAEFAPQGPNGDPDPDPDPDPDAEGDANADPESAAQVRADADQGTPPPAFHRMWSSPTPPGEDYDD